jgi:hypothetical protein
MNGTHVLLASRRAATATVAGLTLIIGVGAPTAAAGAHEPEGACSVSAGSLQWGVKESFRSYISSSIANGAWEVSNGATYTTPTFGWSSAAGGIDPASGLGEISFTGTIVFTGHGGLLRLELSDPTIHIGDDGATLLMDAVSNDPDGEVVVDAQDVVFATLPADVADAAWQPGGSLTFSEVAPVVLTAEGAAAFAGFYAAGEELDPLVLEVTIGDDCAAAPPSDVPPPAADAGGILGGVIAAVVLAAGGAVAAAAPRRRGRV